MFWFCKIIARIHDTCCCCFIVKEGPYARRGNPAAAWRIAEYDKPTSARGAADGGNPALLDSPRIRPRARAETKPGAGNAAAREQPSALSMLVQSTSYDMYTPSHLSPPRETAEEIKSKAGTVICLSFLLLQLGFEITAIVLWMHPPKLS